MAKLKGKPRNAVGTMKRTYPDFFDVFAELPIDHKATVVVALQMYAQTMKVTLGSATFSSKEVNALPIFDDGAAPMEPSKALDFASALAARVY